MTLLKKWAAFPAAALLCAAQTSFAHDVMLNKTVPEGSGLDNAIVIGHGCEASNTGVQAESVVFPTQNPELITSNGSVVTLPDLIGISPFAGQAALIQNHDIFTKQYLKKDTLGNVIGFYSTTGLLQVGVQGRMPFQFTTPTFVKTSCATAMTIEVAIADVCNFTTPTVAVGKLNLWIPNNGSHYANLGGPLGIDGVGEPPSFTITRNLSKNPLPASCGGKGFTVIVRPSATDVNAHLGFGTWHY